MTNRAKRKKTTGKGYKARRGTVHRTGHGVERVLVLILLVFGLVLFVRAAWVSEDAYITFRTIDNFVNGYGLRWNISERVQSYTHPLWMLLMAFFFGITKEFYFTAIVTSLALSFGAVWLIARKLPITPYSVFPALLALLSSKAFVDYTSSGLETPLSFFVLAIFYYLFFRRDFRPRVFLFLCLLASLATLNRFDTILFYVPPLAYFAYETKKNKKLRWASIWKLTLLGCVPLISWLIFSTVYYGFPFPNTAYAKLNTGVPTSKLIHQGLRYFSNSLHSDTVTLSVIFLTAGYLLFKPKKKILYAGLGMVTYLLYVIVIGGDFMSGRFFSLPLLSASALLCRMDFKRSLGVATAVAIVLIGLVTPKPTYLYNNGYSNMEIDENGISDERGFYYQDSGLLKMLAGGNREPISRWVEEGRQARIGGVKTVARLTCGYFGYYAGPRVYIIDLLALSDPLLARLEIPDKDHWRIGHFRRALPEGYVESVATRTNLIEDPEIKKLYSDVNLITKGDVWSTARFKTILRMNLGLH